MRKIFLLIFLIIGSTYTAGSFALLSHEAIIDATWENSIRPLLKHKYPGASEQQLNEAYAYLYGGALMPDIGYSPFGSILFTNLVHYVRSGDFVMAVLDEATNINEYAFGLGLMCHYQADKYGHALGTNLAVPILFPKLKDKHGHTVAYENGCSEHTRVEFGFDVLQAAKGNYDLDKKQKFIGFKVSEPVLERAFLKTYGLHLDDVFGSMTVAVETFRFTIKQLIPQLTKNAWRARNTIIQDLNPTADKKSFTMKMDRKKYRKEFGRGGPKAIFFTIIIGIIPKFGPTSKLKYKEPNEKVEQIFENSFNAIVKHYDESIMLLKKDQLHLENINFDTGKPVAPGTYELADKTNYKLLKELKKTEFKNTDESLRQNMVQYFNAEPGSKKIYKHNTRKRKNIDKTIMALQQSAKLD